MTDPSPSAPRPPAPTTDRLRWEIDSGHSGDKVAYSDPAAAPLGTDDEAAGTPASQQAIAAALASQGGAPMPTGRWRRLPLVALLVVIALVALVALSVLWQR